MPEDPTQRSRWSTAALRPPRTDAGLMLLLLVPSLAQVLLVPIGPRPLGVLFAGLSVVPLAWRRSAPVVAAVVHVAAWWIPLLGFDGWLFVGYVVAVIVFFSVGAYASSLPQVIVVGAWSLTAATATTLLGPEEDPIALLGAWLVCLAPLVAGRLVAAQRARAERMRELADRLEREHALERRTAIAEERARIARDLHDVVGHEMTMIAIQAEAAAAALAQAPDRAVAPVEAIRTTAHRAGSEMRALLGVLRLDEDQQSGLPINEASPEVLSEDVSVRLERLVARTRDGGIDVGLHQHGTPWSDEPAATLAVHRIVQECLTNAGRHAPGQRVDVSVTWTPDEVTVRALNPCPSPPGPPGHGLIGMAERVRLLRGHLDAGAVDGQFSVTATVRAPRRERSDTS